MFCSLGMVCLSLEILSSFATRVSSRLASPRFLFSRTSTFCTCADEVFMSPITVRFSFSAPFSCRTILFSRPSRGSCGLLSFVKLWRRTNISLSLAVIFKKFAKNGGGVVRGSLVTAVLVEKLRFLFFSLCKLGILLVAFKIPNLLAWANSKFSYFGSVMNSFLLDLVAALTTDVLWDPVTPFSDWYLYSSSSSSVKSTLSTRTSFFSALLPPALLDSFTFLSKAFSCLCLSLSTISSTFSTRISSLLASSSETFAFRRISSATFPTMSEGGRRCVWRSEVVFACVLLFLLSSWITKVLLWSKWSFSASSVSFFVFFSSLIWNSSMNCSLCFTLDSPCLPAKVLVMRFC